MPIPDFQTVMRPLLECYSDGAPRRIADAEAQLAVHFSLTPEEVAQMLPSGRQQWFKNRVRWSVTYLKNAGALKRTERGVYRITTRGTDLLGANPTAISVATLKQFEEFRAFHGGSNRGSTPELVVGAEELTTPEEQIAAASGALRQALIVELRERIAAMTPAAFEQLVLDVLVT